MAPLPRSQARRYRRNKNTPGPARQVVRWAGFFSQKEINSTLGYLKSSLLLVLLLLPTALFAGDFYQPIPMAEVAKLMKTPGVTLLDVNVPEVWEKHHIPGAVHITTPDISTYLPTDKKSVLIFYCAGPLCNASGVAANQAVMLGYRRVYVMKDGIYGWVKAGHPVESASPTKN